MKIGSIFFAFMMFTALFGVPVAQTFLQDDTAIVFQEHEEKDAEDGEDIKLKDLEEKLIQSYKPFHNSLFVDQKIQAHFRSSAYFICAQRPGVETPPPEHS